MAAMLFGKTSESIAGKARSYRTRGRQASAA
jgi:hypothetical protein